MNETDADQEPESLIYEVRLKGHLGKQWSDWFNQVVIQQEQQGITCLICAIPDQAALHGLLKKVRDIGAPLISVICLNPELVSIPNNHTYETRFLS